MRTNVIVGGLVAVLGALTSGPLLAEKTAGANKIRSTAEQNRHSAEPQSFAQSVKSQRRERVRHTFPPSKR